MTHWARWVWNDIGQGRFHAIADVGIGIAMDETPSGITAITAGVYLRTACGKVRPEPPEKPVHDPPREQCCPECLALDDIGKRFEGDPDTAPVDSPLVTA